MQEQTFPHRRRPHRGVAAACILLGAGLTAGCPVGTQTTPGEHFARIVSKVDAAGRVCPVRVEPVAGGCSGFEPGAGPEDLCVAPRDRINFQLVDLDHENRNRPFRLRFEGTNPLEVEGDGAAAPPKACEASSAQGGLRCRVGVQTGEFSYAMTVDEGCGSDPRIYVNPRHKRPAGPPPTRP